MGGFCHIFKQSRFAFLYSRSDGLDSRVAVYYSRSMINVAGGVEFCEIPMLSDAGAEDLARGVHSLRAHWIPRAGALPFFTLGAAAYLDGPLGGEVYRHRREAGNGVLQGNFAELYSELSHILSETLGMPVEWHPAAALPGFHIYQMHRAFYGRGGSIHLDLQYDHVNWGIVGDPDFGSVISFTLPVVLPAAGGGLRWWEGIDPDVWTAVSKPERQRMIREAPLHYLPYRVGTLVVHSGQIVHQIAPGQMLESNEERVTLQGHGIRVGDRVVCYW